MVDKLMITALRTYSKAVEPAITKSTSWRVSSSGCRRSRYSTGSSILAQVTFPTGDSERKLARGPCSLLKHSSSPQRLMLIAKSTGGADVCRQCTYYFLTLHRQSQRHFTLYFNTFECERPRHIALLQRRYRCAIVCVTVE